MTSPTSASIFTHAGSAVGAIVGITLSQYSGASLWVPALLCIAFFLILTKTPVRPAAYAPAISVVAGHISWFLLAWYITGNWMDVVFDIILLSIAIAWLWPRASRAAAWFLGGVEALSLVMNLLVLSSSPFGSASHRALVVHCALRILVLALLVVTYRRQQALVREPATVQ